MIAALVEKDIKLFFRNQFFAVVTGLVLVFFIAIFLLLPSTVDETLELALYVEGMAEADLTEALSEGLEARVFDTEEALVAAVENGDFPAGLIVSAEALSAVTQGEDAAITVYYAPGITVELREAYNDVLTVGVNYLILGAREPLDMAEQSEVLGADLAKPVPVRDSMLPMLILMIFLVEMMGLATIIAEEASQGTANALLVTPLGLGQFLTSKAIMGVGLAFIQALILIAVTGRIVEAPLIILISLFLVSLLTTGVAFAISSIARDMMSVVSWGMLVYITFSIPGVTTIFPGISSDWVRAIPTHYFVDTLHRSMNFGASWGELSSNLLMLLLFGVATLALGTVVLRRRFQ